MPNSIPLSVPVWFDKAKALLRHYRLWGTQSADLVTTGQRPAGRAGRGTEWFGRREYVPGDPPNIVDWRSIARHADLPDPPLYSKTFDAEMSNLTTIAVDCSASIGMYPFEGKAHTAVATAMLLAYAAVQNSDPVRIVLVGGSGSRVFCDTLVCRTEHDLDTADEEILKLRLLPAGELFLDVLNHPHDGLPDLGHTVVLLSDFLVEPELLATTLFDYRNRVRSVLAVRVVCPSDEMPFAGTDDLELIDVEEPSERRRVRWSTELYRERWREHSRLIADIFDQEEVRWTTVEAVPLANHPGAKTKPDDGSHVVEKLIHQELVGQM